jgi:hypothetical protein
MLASPRSASPPPGQGAPTGHRTLARFPSFCLGCPSWGRT